MPKFIFFLTPPKLGRNYSVHLSREQRCCCYLITSLNLMIGKVIKARQGIFSAKALLAFLCLCCLCIQDPDVMGSGGILLCCNTGAERVDACFYSSLFLSSPLHPSHLPLLCTLGQTPPGRPLIQSLPASRRTYCTGVMKKFKVSFIFPFLIRPGLL